MPTGDPALHSSLRLNTGFGGAAAASQKDYEAITPTQAKPTDYGLFDAFMPYTAGQQHGGQPQGQAQMHHQHPASAGPTYQGGHHLQQQQAAQHQHSQSAGATYAPYATYAGYGHSANKAGTPVPPASVEQDLAFSSASDRASPATTGPATPPSRQSPVLEHAGYAAHQQQQQHLHPHQHAAAQHAHHHQQALPMVAPQAGTVYGAMSHPGAGYAYGSAPQVDPYNPFYAYQTQQAMPASGPYAGVYGTAAGEHGHPVAVGLSTSAHQHQHGHGHSASSLSAPSSPNGSLYSSDGGSDHTTKTSGTAASGISAAGTGAGGLLGGEGKQRTGGRRALGDKDKKFLCSYPGCTRAFSRNFNLSTHYNTHLGIKPFGCPHCAKSFSRRHDCARHVAAVHSSDGAGAGAAPPRSSPMLGAVGPASGSSSSSGELQPGKEHAHSPFGPYEHHPAHPHPQAAYAALVPAGAIYGAAPGQPIYQPQDHQMAYVKAEED